MNIRVRKINYMGKIIERFSIILFCSSCLQFPLIVSAEGEGGGVTTNGVVNFYSEEQQVITTSESFYKKELLKGNLLNTGELVKTSLMISGVSLILLVIIIFLWKRRKREEGGNQ